MPGRRDSGTGPAFRLCRQRRGGNPAAFAKRGYDRAIEIQLDIGVLDYCGIPERRLEMLYGSMDGEGRPQRILTEAARLGAAF